MLNVGKRRQTTFTVPRSMYYTGTGLSSCHEFLLLYNSSAGSSSCGQRVKAGRKKKKFPHTPYRITVFDTDTASSAETNISFQYHGVITDAMHMFKSTYGNYFDVLINSFVSINIFTISRCFI